jgi:hypothetical protein
MNFIIHPHASLIHERNVGMETPAAAATSNLYIAFILNEKNIYGLFYSLCL